MSLKGVTLLHIVSRCFLSSVLQDLDPCASQHQPCAVEPPAARPRVNAAGGACCLGLQRASAEAHPAVRARTQQGFYQGEYALNPQTCNNIYATKTQKVTKKFHIFFEHNI
jgi:hypothetical protein